MSTITQANCEARQLKFVAKLFTYSLVSTTYEKGCALYEHGKASNAYVAQTLTMMENGAKVAVTMATPYVSKYDEQIHKLDAVACEKLETIEKRVPELAAKLPTVNDARELPKYVLEGGRKVYDGVKPRMDGARKFVDTKYTEVLGTLDTYVDRWLPDETDETEKKDVNVRTLTRKVTTRLGRVAADRIGADHLKPAYSVYEFATGKFDELKTAVCVEFDAEARKLTTEPSANEHTSTNYGDLQRRLHDTVILSRALTHVCTRYTTAMMLETVKPMFTNMTQAQLVALLNETYAKSKVPIDTFLNDALTKFPVSAFLNEAFAKFAIQFMQKKKSDTIANGSPKRESDVQKR